jgi:hypothetical protein
VGYGLKFRLADTPGRICAPSHAKIRRQFAGKIRYVRHQTEDHRHIQQNGHGCSVPHLCTNTRCTLPRTAWPFRAFFAPDCGGKLAAQAFAQIGLKADLEDFPEIPQAGDFKFAQNFRLTVEMKIKKIPAFWEPGQKEKWPSSSNKPGRGRSDGKQRTTEGIKAQKVVP